MSTFVDTSALLAVLDASDASHDVADRVWRRLIEADEHLITTSYVVVETFAVVQARLDLPALRVLADDMLPLLQQGSAPAQVRATPSPPARGRGRGEGEGDSPMSVTATALTLSLSRWRGRGERGLARLD